MLLAEQQRRSLTDAAVAKEHGWLQQTYNRWKKGSLPRAEMYVSVASYLNISLDALAELIDEAELRAENTKLPQVGAFGRSLVYGKVADRKAGKYTFEPFNRGRRRIPDGRYAILIDTKIMEPALHVGTKAWLDPAIWPAVGNEVLVHSKGGVAWIGRLVEIGTGTALIDRPAGTNLTITDVEAIHVIVLSERLPAS